MFYVVTENLKNR